MEELKETKVSTEAAQAAPQKVKKARKPLSRMKRVVIYFAVIVVILVMTNPTVIPFMPEFITGPVQEFMYSIFGNMKDVAEMVKLSSLRCLHFQKKH